MAISGCEYCRAMIRGVTPGRAGNKWDKNLGKIGKSWVKETWSWMFINKNRKNTGNGCDIKKRGFPTPTEPQKRLRFLGFIPKKLGVDAAFHGVQLSSSSIQQGSYSLGPLGRESVGTHPAGSDGEKIHVDPYLDPIHFNDLNPNGYPMVIPSESLRGGRSRRHCAWIVAVIA